MKNQTKKSNSSVINAKLPIISSCDCFIGFLSGEKVNKSTIDYEVEMKFHKTKDGKKIKLADLETSHLENIIKWIERKSKEGLTVRMGGGSCAEDMWYDEETYYGEEAKSKLNFSDYKAELERRVSTCH